MLNSGIGFFGRFSSKSLPSCLRPLAITSEIFDGVLVVGIILERLLYEDGVILLLDWGLDVGCGACPLLMVVVFEEVLVDEACVGPVSTPTSIGLTIGLSIAGVMLCIICCCCGSICCLVCMAKRNKSYFLSSFYNLYQQRNVEQLIEVHLPDRSDVVIEDDDDDAEPLEYHKSSSSDDSTSNEDYVIAEVGEHGFLF